MAFTSFKANEKSFIDRSNEFINAWIHEVNKYKVLDAEEQIQLVIKSQNGDERAKDRLVKSNLRFVISVANTYSQCGLEFLDLVEEGNYGLLKAINLFNPSKQCSFISFAVNYIRQSILQAIINQKGIVCLPDNQHRILSTYRKVADKMFGEDYYTILNAASQEANCSVNTLETLLTISGSPIALDETIKDNDGKGIARIEMLSSSCRTDAGINNECKIEVLNRAFDKVLTPREQTVLRESFGFNGFEESLESISSHLGIGNEHTRKIKNNAIKKLRKSSFASLLAMELAA